MKLSEIKEKLNSGINIQDLNIKINNYISIILKRGLILGYQLDDEEPVVGMLDKCFIDGKLDLMKKEMYLVMTAIGLYADIQFDEDELDVDIYDFIMSSGLYDFVLKNHEDYERFKVMFDSAIEEKKYQLQQENSVENQLKKFLEYVIENIPDNDKIMKLVKNLKKEFNGFKWEKNSVLGKVAKEYGNVDLPTKENIEKTLDVVSEIVKKPEAPKNKEVCASGKVKK